MATGTPEAVARLEGSYTGQYLRDKLPDVELEGPRSGREGAGEDGEAGDGEEDKQAATAATDD